MTEATGPHSLDPTPNPDIQSIHGPRFTLEQQRTMGLRTIEAGRLADDGATYSASGALLLTDDQLVAIHKSYDDKGEYSEAYTTKEAWFNTEISQTPFTPRVSGTLSRAGIRTMRDLLVLGSSRIGTVYGVGDTAMDLIKEALVKNDHGIEWPKKPSIDYVRDITNGNMHNVTSLVLKHPTIWFKHLADQQANDPASRVPSIGEILNIVKTSPDSLPTVLHDRYRYAHGANIDTLIHLAEEYAQLYDQDDDKNS